MVAYPAGKAHIATLWAFAMSQPFDALGAFIFLDSLAGSFSGHEGDVGHSALHACFAAALDQRQEPEARIAMLNLIGEMERRQTHR